MKTDATPRSFTPADLSFMDVIPAKEQPRSERIITDPNKLKEPCIPFDFDNPPMNPSELAYNLVKEMRDFNGIGLAANQMGYPWRVFAMRSDPNMVCFNPKIVMPSEETIALEEACLSFPGLFVKVTRPKHVRARFQLANGDTRTEMYIGLAARVFQHELDHLNGILYYDLANKYHRDLAFKRWKKK